MGLTLLSLGTATSQDTYEGTERHRSIELTHGLIMVRRQDPSQPRRHHEPQDWLSTGRMVEGTD